jgi:hypothetical protein
MVSHKKKTPTNHKLADRDLKLLQLDEEIKKKKQFLFKKRVELEEKKGLNQYLEIVKDDYNKYYEVEVNKKKHELKAMTILNDYISYLEDADHLINSQMLTAKHDKKEILHEINKIKKELDNLTN